MSNGINVFISHVAHNEIIFGQIERWTGVGAKAGTESGPRLDLVVQNVAWARGAVQIARRRSRSTCRSEDGNEPMATEKVVALDVSFRDTAFNQCFGRVQRRSIGFERHVIANDRNT